MTYAAQPEATSLVLVEEFAHRVLNEYTLAIAGLKLAARGVCDDTARGQLTDAADRLFAHAHVHRALAMPTDAHCDVADYIAKVCSAAAKALAPETRFRLSLETPDTVLPRARCWRLALIVSELIHNAARHGDPNREIVVELAANEFELFCRVSNGGGCPAAAKSGRGRHIVLALVRDLGGQADWMFTPGGTCVWIVVPLGDIAERQTRDTASSSSPTGSEPRV
jgi:two-component sensor histidine kinase